MKRDTLSCDPQLPFKQAGLRVDRPVVWADQGKALMNSGFLFVVVRPIFIHREDRIIIQKGVPPTPTPTMRGNNSYPGCLSHSSDQLHGASLVIRVSPIS